MKKEIRCWLFLIALQAAWIGPCVYHYTQQNEEVVVEEKEEVHIEENEIETVTQSYEFYDVPLSEEIQIHIFEECEKRNIAPALVIALIERESHYDENAESNNGAIGLMQVTPRWHEERKERLGCTDLYDPFQNISVGIDYLAELRDKNNDLYWVLMAYNRTESYATDCTNNMEINFYALRIVERAVEIETEKENSTASTDQS